MKMVNTSIVIPGINCEGGLHTNKHLAALTSSSMTPHTYVSSHEFGAVKDSTRSAAKPGRIKWLLVQHRQNLLSNGPLPGAAFANQKRAEPETDAPFAITVILLMIAISSDLDWGLPGWAFARR